MSEKKLALKNIEKVDLPSVKGLDDVNDDVIKGLMVRLPLGEPVSAGDMLVLKYKLGDVYEVLVIDVSKGVSKVFASDDGNYRPQAKTKVIDGAYEFKIMENAGIPLLFAETDDGFVVISPYSGLVAKVSYSGGVKYRTVRVHRVGSRVFIEDGDVKVEVTDELKKLPKVTPLGKLYLDAVYNCV